MPQTIVHHHGCLSNFYHNPAGTMPVSQTPVFLPYGYNLPVQSTIPARVWYAPTYIARLNGEYYRLLFTTMEKRPPQLRKGFPPEVPGVSVGFTAVPTANPPPPQTNAIPEISRMARLPQSEISQHEVSVPICEQICWGCANLADALLSSCFGGWALVWRK